MTDLDARIARARQNLEITDHAAVRERNQVAVDLATAVRRRGELLAAQESAEQARIAALVGG